MSNNSNLQKDKELVTKSLLSFKSSSSLSKFLDDLLTEEEFSDLAQRIKIAKGIETGKTYDEISEKVGTSTATVSKVGQVIKYGQGTFTKLFGKSRGK